MFSSKTVFILGAGASSEAKLPVGSELTAKIASLLRTIATGNAMGTKAQRLDAALGAIVGSDPAWRNNRLLASAQEVAEAMELAPSIDAFLETHASNKEYVLLGKLGIAAVIFQEENSSYLFSKNENEIFQMKNLSGTWYMSLARQLFTGVPVENPEVAFENISFIDFNYDRCIQTFLVSAVQLYFRIERNMAREMVKNIPVFHPYGSLGSIFENVKFGNIYQKMEYSANEIKTFSESVDDGYKVLIRNEIDSAETIIFLGFAFHKQNMDLLDSGISLVADRPISARVFATTLGLSDSDVSVIRGQICRMLRARSELPEDTAWLATHDGSCASLFARYWRSLTA